MNTGRTAPPRQGLGKSALFPAVGAVGLQNGGAAIGVALTGHLSKLTTAGAETGVGGLMMLLVQLRAGHIRNLGATLRAAARFLRRNLGMIAVMITVSAVMNVAYISSAAQIHRGLSTQAMFFAAEMVGTLVVTTLREIFRSRAVALALLTLMAVSGVLVYAEPWAAPVNWVGIGGGFAAGIGMGLRITLVAERPEREANYIKQTASLLAGASLLVAAALVEDRMILRQDLTVGEICWGIFLIVTCGVLSTGLPAMLENVAVNNGASTAVLGVISTFHPFVAACFDMVLGRPLDVPPFLRGAPLVVIGAAGAVVFTGRLDRTREPLRELLEGISGRDVLREEMRKTGRAVREIGQRRLRDRMEEILERRQAAFSVVDDSEEARRRALALVRSPQGDEAAYAEALRALKAVTLKLEEADRTVRSCDRELERLIAEAPRRMRGSLR